MSLEFVVEEMIIGDILISLRVAAVGMPVGVVWEGSGWVEPGV